MWILQSDHGYSRDNWRTLNSNIKRTRDQKESNKKSEKFKDNSYLNKKEELSYLWLSSESEECYIDSNWKLVYVLDEQDEQEDNWSNLWFETNKFWNLAFIHDSWSGDEKKNVNFFNLLDNNWKLFLLDRKDNINWNSLLKVLWDDWKSETMSVYTFLTYIWENYHSRIDKYEMNKIMDKYNINFTEQLINFFWWKTRNIYAA